MASNQSSERCICIDLRTTAQKLTQAYDEAMAPSGISVTQFSQMNLIRSLDGPTLTELAEESQLERSTLGRNLKVLEKMGLIESRVGLDARSKTLHLTRRGQTAFKRAVPLWYAVQNELVERIGYAQREQLNELLDVLSEPLALSQN